MKQTFPLQEVIDDLVNTDKSLSAPLMKLNYFSRLIKNQELIDYTQYELNGYSSKSTNIPEYRRIPARLIINMQMHTNHHSRELPVSMLDEQYRSNLKYIYVTEGIATVESLARKSQEDNAGELIEKRLPMGMLHIFQTPARKLYKGYFRVDVVEAKLIGNANMIVEIINAVRVKLLEFVMSIAETFGQKIEIESFNKKENNNQIIIQYMNTTVNNSGDGNVINTGNENQIENNVTLYKGNIERLKEELQKQGIEQNDINQITEIVAVEKPDIENNRLGVEANGWISGIVNKSLNGIGKIAVGVTANLLASLIKEFYGMA